MTFYLDGKEVAAPKLTKLERKLAKKLSTEEFGDLDYLGAITTRPDDWCGEGGFTYVDLIEWPDRRQLGALLTSLQRKKLIVMGEGKRERKPATEVWFDCETLAALAE